MPLLYLAKVNLNSDILKVYDGELNIKDICTIIYNRITDGNEYLDNEQRRYKDSFGNPTQYICNSKYTFQEIAKSNNIIIGKLVKTFEKASEKLDENSNKMIDVFVEESVSIHFYYDVYNELIAFCERQSFGYKQFSRAFAKMLNSFVPEYGFEIYLEKDKDLLNEKLKNIDVVKKVKAKLIPPNSNDSDIKELASVPNYKLQCEDTNSIKMNIEYVSDNMNMDSKVMKEIINAVSNGYGDVTAIGLNKNNRVVSVNSSAEAAFTNNIKENIGGKEFIEESVNLIKRFLKTSIRRG